MGEALFPKAQRGYVKIHRWKKYNVVSTTTYKWNKYNVVSTTTYKWNKWNAVSTTNYVWDKYSASNPSYTAWKSTAYHASSTLRPYKSYTYDGRFFTLVDRSSSNVSTLKGNAVGMYWTDVEPISSIYELTAYNGVNGSSQSYEITMYASSNFGFPMTTPEKISLSSNNYVKQSYIGTVTSTSSDTYPNGGGKGGYWYENRKSSTSYSKGSTSYGQVTSTSSSAYPSNGASGSYWYESAGSSTSYSKGSTSYGQVSSTNSSAYPDNGKSGSYWYVYSTSSTSYSKGSYITDVVSTDPNAYPANGKSGSYWYVYDGVS